MKTMLKAEWKASTHNNFLQERKGQKIKEITLLAGDLASSHLQLDLCFLLFVFLKTFLLLPFLIQSAAGLGAYTTFNY